MAISLTDTHCHLDLDAFADDRQAVLERAAKAGIKRIIIPATTRHRWATIHALCQPPAPPQHNIALFPCYGIHPYWAQEHDATDIEALHDYLQQHPALAIGECGLDFRPTQLAKENSRKQQRALFEAQLQLAYRLHLPVVIHAVKATQEVIETLRQFPGLRGMIHAYSGSYEQAKELIALGFYLGIGASVTFPNAHKRQLVVKKLPFDAILLETDAPDQPPHAHHSQRNEPAFITETLHTIARLKNVETETVAQHNEQNARQLFSHLLSNSG